MAIKFIKLVNEHTKIRNPATGEYLPIEGADVEMTSFWRARKRDGDVVELTDVARQKALKAIAAKAKTVAQAAAKARAEALAEAAQPETAKEKGE